MKTSNWLWLPRFVIFVYIVFFSLFSLDVFGGDTGFWEQLLGFLIHSSPALILALIIALTWKRPLLTGVGLIITGILMMLHYEHFSNLNVFLMIEFPVFLIGSSFIIYELMVKDSNDSEDKNSAGSN